MYLEHNGRHFNLAASKGNGIMPPIISKIYFTSLIILCLGFCGVMKGQDTLWPGDINNNGTVNSWDVLYWTIANANQFTGPQRTNQSTSWEEIELNDEILWDQSFPTNINYVYADCNGDGQINNDDLAVIESNFGRTRAQVTPEAEIPVNSLEDPRLNLFSQQQDTVKLGDTISFRLDLQEGEVNKVADFWAIAFTIKFDPEYIEDGPDGLDQIDYEIVNGSTFLGTFPDEVNFFAIQNRIPNNEDRFHVVVYRTSTPLVGNQSLGEIGRSSAIVTEQDILFGPTTIFEIEDIILINKDLDQTPVEKGDKKEITIFEILINSTYEFGNPNEVKIYPIPLHENVTVSFVDPSEKMDFVKVYDLNGKLVLEEKVNANALQTNMNNLQKGQYYLTVYKEDTIYIKTILKQ